MKYQSRFTKQQVLFMAETVFAAGIDRIESALPPSFPADGYDNSSYAFIRGVMSTVGMSLSILYTQLNPKKEGLLISDALTVSRFEGAVETLIITRLKAPDYGKLGASLHAEYFVNDTFDESWFAAE